MGLCLWRNFNCLQFREKPYLSPELQTQDWAVCISKFRTLTILNLETNLQPSNANCFLSLPSEQSSELRVYLVKLQFDRGNRQQKILLFWKMQNAAAVLLFSTPPISFEKPRCILFRFKRIRMLQHSQTQCLIFLQ